MVFTWGDPGCLPSSKLSSQLLRTRNSGQQLTAHNTPVSNSVPIVEREETVINKTAPLIR